MNSYAALLYWMLAASPNVEASETGNTVTEAANAQPRDRKPAVGIKRPEEPALSESDVAYLDAIANMPGGPLGPQQIRQLKQEHRERLREEIPNDPPSQAISTILQASLQPAALAPSITLYHGYVTSIDLVDSTGQPWPAYSPTIGDEQAVQIEGMIKTEKEDSASLVLKPGVRYANTNLVIPLRGGQRPITVLLRNDDPKPGKAVYDRITLVIDGRQEQDDVARRRRVRARPQR